MADGKHCPECSKDIGYRAVALGLFSIRCPHCRIRLRYAQSPGMSRLTTTVALVCVCLGLVLAFFASVMLFRISGILAALLGGFVIWLGSSFGLGFVCQIGLALMLRRTQNLIAEETAEDTAEVLDDDSW